MCQPKVYVQQLVAVNFVLPRIESGLRNWLHTTVGIAEGGAIAPVKLAAEVD